MADEAVLQSLGKRRVSIRGRRVNGRYDYSSSSLEVDLIDIPSGNTQDSRNVSASTLQGSLCSTSLTAAPCGEVVMDGIAHRTFESGDELPCGFKLCDFSLSQECSSRCDSRFHNLKLSLPEKDIWRWEAAGRSIHTILSKSCATSTEHLQRPLCESNIMPEHLNQVSCSEGDSDPSQIPRTLASHPSPLVPIMMMEPAEDMLAEPPQRSEMEQNMPIPIDLEICRKPRQTYFGPRVPNFDIDALLDTLLV